MVSHTQVYINGAAAHFVRAHILYVDPGTSPVRLSILDVVTVPFVRRSLPRKS